MNGLTDSITQFGKFSESKISLFYQNIDGFVGSRSLFLNSGILDLHNIVLLQETNLHSVRHANFENLSFRNWTGVNLSTKDEGEYVRGSLLAYKNGINIPYPTIIKPEFPFDKFDIRAAKFDFVTYTLNIVSVYRSPSFKTRSTCIEFFDFLKDFVSSLTGMIIIAGDFNLDRDRLFSKNIFESVFIDNLCSLGFVSQFEGITRPKSNRQLDYILTNFDVCSVACKGLVSDHRAICTIFSLELDLIRVPTRFLSSIANVSVRTVKHIISNAVALLLKDSTITNGELLFEYECLIFDIFCFLGRNRVIDSHLRVPGLSRQISNFLLSEANLSSDQSRRELLRLQKLDAARRFRKFSSSNSLAQCLYSLYALPSKKSSTNCNVPAGAFEDKILKHNSINYHASHPTHACRENIVDTSVDLVELSARFPQKPFSI